MINQTQTRYQVIFKQDKSVIGTYSTRKRANTKRNKLDLEYGAYGYSVKAVEIPV